MTEQQRADRLVRTFLESEAPERVPDGLLDRIDFATRTSRPRPAWVARLEGHHMDVITGGRRTSGFPRLGLLLAVIALVAAVAAAAIFVGSQKKPTVVTPDASQAPQSSPRFSAAARIPEPGDPIPDDLIGVWSLGSSEFLYIQRGPDPYCQQRFRAVQDCWIFYDGTQGGIQAFGDILTLVDGKIRIMSIGLQDCNGSVSTVTYTRTGDVAQLHVEKPSCFTRDFPPMTLVGSPSGPESAPPRKFP